MRTHGGGLKHWQHARPAPIDDGQLPPKRAGRRWSGRSRRASGRGQARDFLAATRSCSCANDCAEHSAVASLPLVRRRLSHATHQKQVSDAYGEAEVHLPRSASLEQSLTMKGSLPIFEERGSDFEAVRIAQKLPTWRVKVTEARRHAAMIAISRAAIGAHESALSFGEDSRPVAAISRFPVTRWRS